MMYFSKPSREPGQQGRKAILVGVCALMLMPFSVRVRELAAHDTAHQQATHILERGSATETGEWQLRMRFARATLDAVLRETGGQPRSMLERKQRLRDYLAQTVMITSRRGARAQLVAREISIGSHESVFVYDVVGLPAKAAMLRVRIAAAREIPGHTNYLYSVSANGEHTRYSLRAAHDFSARVQLTEISGYALIAWALASLCAMLALGVMLWQRLRGVQRLRLAPPDLSWGAGVAGSMQAAGRTPHG